MFDAKGAKAGEESGDIGRIRDGESVMREVVLDGKAEKFGGDGVGFDVV